MGAWITKASMIHSRSEIAVGEVKGKMYVLGGYADGNVAQTLNEEYDPDKDMWYARAPLPRGGNHIAAVGLDGKLYAIGGFSEQNANAFADVSAYDPETDKWVRKAPLPQPLGSMAVAAVDGVIHAVGRIPDASKRIEVKFFDLEVEGQRVRMAYRDLASEGKPSGPPIVLLHGKNFSGFYWERTMRELAAQGRRVIAPDQLGFGDSSKPDLHYSFHQLARLTALLLDHLDVKRAVVVGHSMGGMLAARFALLYPKRTLRLVLENPIGLEDYRTLVPYLPIDEQYAEELHTTYAAALNYHKTYYAHWKVEFEDFVKEQMKWRETGEWPRYAKASALTYEMIYLQPVLFEFPRIAVPTLLIIGQSDRTVVGKARLPAALKPLAGQYPTLGRKAKAAISRSKLVEIPDCGHIPHVETHAEFMKAVVEFTSESVENPG